VVQQRNDPYVDPVTAPTAVPGAEERSGPALRGAREVLARIAADEAEADTARASYARHGLPSIEPDGAIGPELGDEERVHVIRSSALLNRHEPAAVAGDASVADAGGTLYLTSSRLVHIGQAAFSVLLESLDEISIVGERLLLTLSSGEGLSIDVAGPRLLRVQIGMARKAAHQ
jgi:hypothetical protein